MELTFPQKGDSAVDESSSPGVIEKPPIEKPDAIPSFLVNDESKIEVTLVSHQLQESMATNNFASSAIEVGG